MLNKIISTIFEIIFVLPLTAIGMIFRGIQLYCYQGDEKSTTGNIMLFVLSIIFYILGFLWTRSFLEDMLKKNKDDEVPAAIISVILSIAIPIFFMFYTSAGIFVGKIVMIIIQNIISCIIAIFVILFVFGMISGISEQNASNPLDTVFDENLKRAREQEKETYDRYKREAEERERYVRDNWNSSLGRLNSDATAYETPKGNWNKISKDGKYYEDDNGNWEHL